MLSAYRPLELVHFTDLVWCGKCNRIQRRRVTELHKCPFCGYRCCAPQEREP